MGDERGEVRGEGGSWLVRLGCGGCGNGGTGGWGRRVREVVSVEDKSILSGMAEAVCEDK